MEIITAKNPHDYPKPQEIYRHFKGNLYQIISLAIHTETNESLVIYQALYDNYQVYARPLSNFIEEIDRETYPETDQKYRFIKVEKNIMPIQTKQRQEKTTESSKPIADMPEDGIDEDDLSQIDPQVMKFLNAGTFEERLQILTGLRHRITDEMINTMAVSVDLDIAPGEPEVRYDELHRCLITMGRFEVKRLR